MFNTSTKERCFHRTNDTGHQYSKGTTQFAIPQYGFNIQHMYFLKPFVGY